jgi:hypothetical protein
MVDVRRKGECVTVIEPAAAALRTSQKYSSRSAGTTADTQGTQCQLVTTVTSLHSKSRRSSMSAIQQAA